MFRPSFNNIALDGTARPVTPATGGYCWSTTHSDLPDQRSEFKASLGNLATPYLKMKELEIQLSVEHFPSV